MNASFKWFSNFVPMGVDNLCRTSRDQAPKGFITEYWGASSCSSAIHSTHESTAEAVGLSNDSRILFGPIMRRGTLRIWRVSIAPVVIDPIAIKSFDRSQPKRCFFEERRLRIDTVGTGAIVSLPLRYIRSATKETCIPSRRWKPLCNSVRCFLSNRTPSDIF